jgi:acetyl esterase/lipase
LQYINRKPRRSKPTAHISYDLGLNVIRRFIEFTARHTVEDVQAFTAQRVPVPHWVRVEHVDIPAQLSKDAGRHLIEQLGPKGVAEVGGTKWWQWRCNDELLRADWIEMRKDFIERNGKKTSRVILYVHGGAYYFGSVDEHRYQIQRHARKLKARAFAPRYRLAPQFPFPCGLHDILTAYLYLLSEYDPKCILLAGDSAGGGLIASTLVTIRDQGLPLPAGAMLLSPWVDLTHSFPSICDDGKLDYIPIHGFVHKPSVSWPPPQIGQRKGTSYEKGESAENTQDDENPIRPPWMPSHVADHHIAPAVEINGKTFYIRDQIQLYAPNYQLINPLVSPALSPSLGGLCPLLVQVGGGELLRDEQVYFAHKAANPAAYPPNDEVMQRWDPKRELLHKYRPTNVQLQVLDDACHVCHTISWSRPAKYLYRSVAQFGAWALARAQQVEIDIDDDESGSEEEKEAAEDSPDGESSNEKSNASKREARKPELAKEKTSRNTVDPLTTFKRIDSVGKAGDPLPPFEDHMIRQRVDLNGTIYPLGPASMFFSLRLSPNDIGVVKEAPVHRWRERQERWDRLYLKLHDQVLKQRYKLEEQGMVAGMEGEHPPPTALVRRWLGEQKRDGRRKVVDELKKKPFSVGLTWWSGWGSKHDRQEVSRVFSSSTQADGP